MQVLQEYLSTGSGLNLWKAYENNSCDLTIQLRDKLVKEIIQYHIDNKIFMHETDFMQITNEICSTFVKETANTYFNGNGKYPSGRLYNTYKNSASKLRKIGLFPREKRLKRARLTPDIPEGNFK